MLREDSSLLLISVRPFQDDRNFQDEYSNHIFEEGAFENRQEVTKYYLKNAPGEIPVCKPKYSGDMLVARFFLIVCT